MTEHFDYDPNHFYDACHTVRVTYGSWRYRATHVVMIHGNCKGGDICEAAIERFVEDFMGVIEDSGGFAGDYDDETGGVWQYVCTDANGDTLSGEVYGSERDCERDIRKMIIGVEITDLGGEEVEAKRARDAKFEADSARRKELGISWDDPLPGEETPDA